ncbi:helix-turn-helix domain-containing protein [Xinfangfangia pollutisoli]|uniref:helix-turn-helix domain-containing protein n=1 Tax=Xinfangfangia pollutisoli TaxID=2865960 RepID=UPI001CD608BC|nr:helix-turn-helix domain-containing protein [Xinfangfangia pollutisoli]
MSHAATNWAFSQRGLKPSAKIVLLILADCHNPAHGCFPTQAFLADACEMNRDTVNVQLAHLEERGLIRRVRSIDPATKRQRPTRYKLSFEADFDGQGCSEETPQSPAAPVAKSAQKPVSEIPTQTPKAVSEFPAEPCRKNGQSRVGNPDTNLVKEPVMEPCVGGAAAHTSKAFEEFWKVYPRPRDRQRAERLFVEALEAGVGAEVILGAARHYRAENAGNKPQYLAYADNWLDQRRWEDCQAAAPVVARTDAVRDLATFWAKKVKCGAYIPPSGISAEVAHCMIQGGLVREQDLLRVGVRL